MNYETDKAEVVNLFDHHILKYVVKDLEVLDNTKPDASGAGGCTIPQAASTFAALDLIGYLIHPQEQRTVKMSFGDLIKNDTYFPEFKEYLTQTKFIDSFRDNLRTMMVHRFSLAKYDIAKIEVDHLFIEKNGRQIFNASYFTKITLAVINKIYNQIKGDTFIINGRSKEESMEKIKERIISLRNYEGDHFTPLTNLPSLTTDTQTTSSIG